LAYGVLEWLGQFKEGQEGVQDDPSSGQLIMQRRDSNVDREQTLVQSDQRLGAKTNSRRRLWYSVFRGKDPYSGLTSGFLPVTVPVFRICEFLAKKLLLKRDYLHYSSDLPPTIFVSFQN
jgi:hypothetical protein